VSAGRRRDIAEHGYDALLAGRIPARRYIEWIAYLSEDITRI
jgi:hypothetical protein